MQIGVQDSDVRMIVDTENGPQGISDQSGSAPDPGKGPRVGG